MEIDLTLGLVAIIDDDDWGLVSQYKWHAYKGPTNNTYYAKTNVRRADGSRTTIRMHRLLLGLTDPTIKTDHRDGDGLNNRRANLRACTQAENLRNQGAHTDNMSGYKGVSWHKRSGMWIAQIQVNWKKRHLGLFDTQEAAYAAYCKAAAELHGGFCNFGSSGQSLTLGSANADRQRQADGRQ